MSRLRCAVHQITYFVQKLFCLFISRVAAMVVKTFDFFSKTISFFQVVSVSL